MNNKNARQSNIELLRIVAMLLVVSHHVAYHGGGDFPASVISVNRIWNQAFTYVGKVGLDIFVIISGYFMAERKSLNISRVAKLWLQMITYSLALFLIAVIFFGAASDVKYVVIACTPFLSEQWPFVSAYMMMFILSPFINLLIRRLTKKQYRLLIAIIMIFWVMIPTLLTFKAESNYFVWVTALYIIAAYVRLYPEDFQKKSSFYMCGALIVTILSVLSALVFDLLGFKWGVFAEYATHFSDKQHLNVLLWAMFLFLAFKNLNVKDSSLINTIAGLMFGVFLLHDDFYSRELLWGKIFDNTMASGKAWYIAYFLFETLSVLIVCSLVEWLRQNLLEKHYMKPVAKKFEKLQLKFDSIMEEESRQNREI